MRCTIKKTQLTSLERELFWRRGIDQDVLSLLHAGKVNEAKEILAGRMKECN